ncbi:MAG: DNA recombination protein RmuC [Pseudomonadota bacterium]|nr:DNA recombination protein RmuC [Gammaproteobacteria bacterium]MBU1558621.1 DNA recombination protein RmuC [Gammaproteobacteria bacterium]MBU1926628.1 DNA recombination protein RmuC [Gammaproteobacteria bacterium]MBU2545805.1 DNA recombination protein RmuC [Gammaproteobacteria bacterium]
MTYILLIIVLLIFLGVVFFQARQGHLISREINSIRPFFEERARFTDDLSRRIQQESLEKVLQFLNDNRVNFQKELSDFRAQFDKHQMESFKNVQESLFQGVRNTQMTLTSSLQAHSEELNKRVEKLTKDTDLRLKEISGQVEKRLSEGFEKTTATFTDVIKRLALIDEAQKRITELSSNVLSLQEVLSDKKSRGAFGEVQLSLLVRDKLPENTFEFQHTLSNGKRVDCFLWLPKPTGNISIDAKFPLENYRKMLDSALSEAEKQTVKQQFRHDIRKHIVDVAEKYIIPGETSDGAILFIPSEAVFAEIHANFPELVEASHAARVWLTSPTTMMAILTTVKAVLKDEATREQVHLIQEHLNHLATDFDRFQSRMDNLAKHIHQANDDVDLVHKSAKKITSRFNKIEKVELQTIEKELPGEDND